MAASVTIHHGAFGDDRMLALARLAGYPGGVDEALGKMARLWSVCTELQTSTPPVSRIRSCLGPGGERWLVEADLGVLEAPGGPIRVRGTTGRTEWYQDLLSAQSKAGKARAATAQRDSRGRLQPVQLAGSPLGRAGSSGPPASSSALVTLDPALDQRPQLPPAPEPDLPEEGARSDFGVGSGADLVRPEPPTSTPPPGRTRSGEGGRPEVQPVVPRPAEDPPPRYAPPPSANPQVRAVAGVLHGPDPGGLSGPPPLDPGAALRRRLVAGFPARCNAARAAIVESLKLGRHRPVALMGEGEKALMERLRDSADPEADLDHVLEVAAREARETRELRWLSWSVATPKAWAVKLAASLPAKARPRPVIAELPTGAVAAPEAPLSDSDRAELSALARRIASNPRDPERNLSGDREPAPAPAYMAYMAPEPEPTDA